MPKSDLVLASGDYAPVAQRITLFYERFPSGRIVTDLVSRTSDEVIFKASVYRAPEDATPAATGWASEREGDGDVNAVACLENTETSAIGRALANLGFTASAKRPSAEEMEKASRARARLANKAAEQRRNVASTPSAQLRRVDDDPLQRRANQVSDLLALLRTAERQGLRPRRTEALRARANDPALPPSELARIAAALRRWVRTQGTKGLGAANQPSPQR